MSIRICRATFNTSTRTVRVWGLGCRAYSLGKVPRLYVGEFGIWEVDSLRAVRKIFEQSQVHCQDLETLATSAYRLIRLVV